MNKITFKNADGQKLEGRLELPSEGEPTHFAVFAHCFTCSKNVKAAVNISRALSKKGVGVLRFDFTGLGESDGDFSETNFSGNVEDLVLAAKFLEENYNAPTLLVGHSLGGAAVIFAAQQLPSVKAVATIGAPAQLTHVKNLFKDREKEILQRGAAKVHLDGREFTIRRQFLEDLQNQPLKKILNRSRLAYLFLHSPQDKTVSIQNAEELYVAAHHPKSFISLDGADHLLTRDEDAAYAGIIIADWASRYAGVIR